MIIKEIHIDGFGIFNGFSLTTLDKGVHIIHGNNEAGKSTLLKFLRYTLFGYPRFKDQRMAPLNGGNHGGRIKAVLSSGKEVLFNRSGNDSINLLYNGQETRNQSQWSQLLGNASADLYNNVYAFSLDELVDLGSLTESGVEDKIFSVGLGLGNISVGTVERNIQSRVDNIYTRRGRNQLIPCILKGIEDKRSKVQRIQENLHKYKSLNLEMKDLEENIREVDREIEEYGNEKNKLENYLKCYDSFIEITRSEEELEKLPGLQNYPEKGKEQLDKLEEKEQELIDRIRGLSDGTEDQKGIHELEETIKDISVNSKLLGNKDTVEYLRNNLPKYIQTINDKDEEEQRIKDYQRSINQGIANISGQWTEHNITGFTDIAIHRNKLERYKEELDKLADKKRESEAELKATRAKDSRLNINNMTVFTAIIFLTGSIPAFYYGLYVLGATLVFIALLLFFSKKLLVKKDSDSYLQNEIDNLNRIEQKIREEYGHYLEQTLNISKSLSIDAALAVFESISYIKNEINERNRLADKVDKQRLPFIRELEDKVSLVKDILENNLIEEKTEIVVNRIAGEFKSAEDEFQVKIRLEEELKRKKKDLENTESKRGQIQIDIKNLLNSVHTDDRQDFRGKYDDNNRVKTLIEKRDQAIETIEKFVGHNKADEVIAYLEANEKQNIESKLTGLAGEIKTKSRESKDRTDELGGKKNEIKRIEGESEIAELLTGLETERQKLKNAYHEWITGKLALKILTDVKSKYEKEKQPEVIKKSGNFFSSITGHRYKRIRVSLDERDVAVYDPKEVSKKIDQLSRGTREQLLISLRLGFIEEYEKQAEPLPLIVDEVLVNFDPHRAGQTAKIIREFGENRQILIFTCSESTLNYFERSSVNLICLNDLNI